MIMYDITASVEKLAPLGSKRSSEDLTEGFEMLQRNVFMLVELQ